MAASHEFISDHIELGRHPLAHGPPHQQKLPRLGSPANMREPQEVESLQIPLKAPFCPPFDRIEAEGNQSGLLGVEFQPESLQSPAQFVQKTRSVLLPLEPNNEIVGIADNDNVTARMTAPPLLDPGIQGIVKKHVCQER
jgi:hypothetical protein